MNLEPYQKSAFLLNVQVGKPYQKIQLRIDTGSSEVLLPSIKCKNCKVKYEFDLNKSKTLKILEKKSYPRCYGDGCYYGMLVRDLFFLKKKYEKYLKFFLGNSCSIPLGGVQGILGLNQDSALMNVLKMQGNIQHASFSLLLRYKKGRSKIVFGGYNPNDFIGQLVFLKMLPSYYYMIELKDIKVNKFSLVSGNRKIQGMLDSGNSNFGFTEEMYQRYRKYMASKGVICYKLQQQSPKYYTIVCYQKINDIKNHYPDLEFYFNNQRLVMEAEKYINPSLCVQTMKKGRKVRLCYLGLETGGGLVFGSIFFDSFYIYFNQENRTIGIAKSKTLI